MNDGKRVARLRLLKRISVIGLISSGIIALVFLILSFISRGNAAFTIRIDHPNQSENNNFRMLTKRGEDSSTSTYLAADPMNNTDLVDAMEVEKYLKTIETFEGSQNMRSEDDKRDFALVYTIYLQNVTNEDISVRYIASLDGYKEPEQPKLMDYFRILIQTESDGEISNTYYGNRRSSYSKYINYENDNKDDREVIGTTVTTKGEDGDSKLTIPSNWDKRGNDGYCINFNDYQITNEIVNSRVNIKANSEIRFTYVAFFEGGDPDSFGVVPEDTSYLLLSLHLGE